MIEANFNNPEIGRDMLQAGDEGAFTALVEQTSGKIYHTALRILGDTHLAEDVLQETYIKAFQNLPKFEGRSAVPTWLYRIAVNESLMVLRKQKRHLQETLQDEEEDLTSQLEQSIIGWSPQPEELLMKQELREQLDAAIMKLPLNLRLVFILRDIYGFSIAETAQALEISETNTKVRLLRARVKLRNYLDSYLSKGKERE